MFAIFLHESMTQFYQIISSFPTLIFSVMLIVCIAYWLIAVLGLVDIEILDIDMDGDIDLHDSSAAQQGIAGVLMKFGLNGVPLTIIISLIATVGWVTSYYAMYYFAPLIPNVFIFTLPFKLAVLIGSLFAAVYSTAYVIRPLRKIFRKLNIDETKHIIGQAILVRSSSVTSSRGEGMLEDGGAGLLLNIRSTGSEEFHKGDIVIAIEQIEDQNLYRVISQTEFERNQ